MLYSVRKAEDTDFQEMDLRPADLLELQATRGGIGQSPEDLKASLRLPEGSHYTVRDEAGTILLMYGVTTVVSPPGLRTGLIWMMGTPFLENCSMAFLRRCKDYFQSIASGYDIVYNYVDARNMIHLNWLKWLGFSFLKETHISSTRFYLVAKLMGDISNV